MSTKLMPPYFEIQLADSMIKITEPLDYSRNEFEFNSFKIELELTEVNPKFLEMLHTGQAIIVKKGVKMYSFLVQVISNIDEYKEIMV